MALVMLALSAALATATFSAAHALRRAAITTRLQARVETGVQRAFGEVLARWSPALDTMSVGSGVDVALPPEPSDAGPPLVRRARVMRVAVSLYAVTVDLRAVTSRRLLARRRARLWLERPPPDDGTGTESPPVATPVVVTEWAFSDLY
jgi:hypothetical protein